MQITEVRVRLMDSPKMRAVASVTFDGCFVVHDIKTIDLHIGYDSMDSFEDRTRSVYVVKR